jgi:hypothetical protein
MKTYKTSASQDLETMNGKSIVDLLSDDLKREREQNTELHQRINDLSREIGVLRYLENHVQHVLEGSADMDQRHIQSLFESLQRIRGFYA